MLKDAIKSAVIEELSKIELYLLPLSSSNQVVLNFLYNNNIIDDKTIEGALEENVLKTARRQYNHILKNQPLKYWGSLDHYIIPEYFAYAIQKGFFPEKELKKIRFEHGETSEDFVREFGNKNLLSHLRENLLNPPTFKAPENFDEDEVCNSCGF